MRSTFAIGKIGRRAVQVAVVTALVATMGSSAYAQSTGASQKPYVMIIMDTSASMEWTDEGDEEYPKAADGTAPWAAESQILDSERYGPCYVWEAKCSQYDRPSWNTDEAWSENYTQAPIAGRLSDMRGTSAAPGPRLQNKSQPRHVTLKEILTGEMVLKREGDTRAIGDLSPTADAPGCWIVPRQLTATAQSGLLCADSGTPNYGEFDDYPDAREPRPHFQEVFDGQLPNGLMDTVGSNAIFAVAMFDGFKDQEDDAVHGWEGHGHAHDLDDPMQHNNVFAGLTEGKGESDKAGEPDKYNYNLGLFQIVAPKKLGASSTIAGQISGFVQYALVDAGFLSDDDDYRLKPDSDDDDVIGRVLGGEDTIKFAKVLKDYFDEYDLGRQPMAKATPLAAAMHDIHQYFAHGHEGKLDKDSPIIEDSYKNCRPKHVIMLTDGYPEPERPGGVDLGTDTLNSAFGYDKRQYPYPFTEKAIEAFVTDSKYTSTDPADGFPMTARYSSSYPYTDSYLVGSWNAGTSSDSYLDACRYNPRVHVVGQIGHADNSDPNAADPLEDKVIHKLAKMGVAGRTCAGHYLGTDWIPSGFKNGAGEDGTCDPSSRACLDERQAEFMSAENSAGRGYDYIKIDGSTVECNFPSLILSSSNEETNMVGYTADAMQLLFNSIVGSGLQSRTRPTFVNRLDDPDHDIGGQYRFFSGVSVDNGEIFWRGLMYRQDRVCEGSTPEDDGSVSIHDEINACAGTVSDPDAADDKFDTGAVSDDRRRIFTSFATNDSFDYTNRKADSLATDGTRYRFWFGMDLEAANDDEFIDRSGSDSTYLSFTPQALLKRRISFEYADLKKVVENLTGDTSDAALLDYFNVVETEDLEQLIHEVRGRTNAKEGRAFGAILNSSPVAVEPPNLDLPIDSYREYKALYAERPSMLYVATTDGMLHAIHAGELEDNSYNDQVMKRDGSGNEAPGSMHEQREAWAYIPQMLHKKLALYKGQPPSLMDGTPSVKDVRLCHGDNDYNLNKQACACAGTDCNVDPVDQWRTVLVQGLGGVEGGTGYFALDVTRPGGESAESTESDQIEPPDPIPLWEIDPNWERGQVEILAANDKKSLVYPPTDLRDDPIDQCDDSEGDPNYFWDQPFMGASVGEAAIGTLALNDNFASADTQKRLRRPVAVISGGAAAEFGTECDRDLRSGRAIYVVDLQTGSLLRRFVSYKDDAGNPALFPDAITGSPALYNSSPGSLATRAFVGDGGGRLFRIDFSNDDPEEWEVRLFFDPANNTDISASGPFGPASYKPALALGTDAVNNDLLVFYGLGERGDLSTTGTTQMMIALQEKVTTTLESGEYVSSAEGKHIWSLEFQDADDDQVEKLTSEAVIFNKGVYFTTFVEPTGDRCEAGWSRIYGLDFEGDGGSAKGLWTDGDLASGTAGYGGDASTHFAYEPSDPASLTEPDVVRGLTITLGATCLSSPDSATGGTVQSQPKQPTLIAQSSSNQMSGNSGDSFGESGSTESLNSIEQKLDALESQNIPLSWAIIDN